MKDGCTSVPGGDEEKGHRRFMELTRDTFGRPGDFAWRFGMRPVADAVDLQIADAVGGLIPTGQPCVAGDASAPFLRATRPEDLKAAVESIEREGRLYEDSGVDFVRVVDGHLLIGQAKAVGIRRPGQVITLSLLGRPGRRRVLYLVMAAVSAACVWSGTNPIWMQLLGAALPVPVLLLIQHELWRELSRVAGTRVERPLTRFAVHRLTDLAAVLAGRRCLALRAEWRAHLAGESGHDPVTWRKVREALGFVASAIQVRLADVAEAAWTPVDVILKSRTLSNMLVFGPTASAAVFILRHLGTLGVLTSAESISAIGASFYGLVRVGRWWRDVKPPEPQARRKTKE